MIEEEHDCQEAFKKMAEALGTAHTCGRGLLRGWWWPVGPELVFNQMTVPVPKIMDSTRRRGDFIMAMREGRETMINKPVYETHSLPLTDHVQPVVCALLPAMRALRSTWTNVNILYVQQAW
jgi:hypothetical protein